MVGAATRRGSPISLRILRRVGRLRRGGKCLGEMLSPFAMASRAWMEGRADSLGRNKAEKMGCLCTEMKSDLVFISDMALEPKLCCKFPSFFFCFSWPDAFVLQSSKREY